MTTDANFQAAIEREIAWKGDEFRAFAVALVELALASHEPTFTTDIVPDERRGTGNGIPGSVTHTLKSAHVIEPVGHFKDSKFYPEKKISTREGRNSSPIGIYRLVSVGIAREFLRRHGVGCPALRGNNDLQRESFHQPEMFEQPSSIAALAR